MIATTPAVQLALHSSRPSDQLHPRLITLTFARISKEIPCVCERNGKARHSLLELCAGAAKRRLVHLR